MLKSPRRLPNRFNRPVTPQTRRLVERRHQRKRQHVAQRWQRSAQRFKRRADSIKKTAKRFAVLSVSGLFLLCLGLALFSPIMHVKEVRISRSDPRIDAETVQRSLGPLFNRHLFFLSTQEIADLLASSVPDMRGARVTKQYPSTIQIRLSLDPIVARLAIENPGVPVVASGALAGSGADLAGSGAVQSPLSDYLTDEGMYVTYLPSQVESGSGMIQLRIVDWGVRPEPWKPLVSRSTLDVIRQAEAEIKSQYGLTTSVKALYLRAREFHLQTPRYALWFDFRSPIAEQLERYKLFLDAVGNDVVRTYVDLRLKDKIVYR